MDSAELAILLMRAVTGGFFFCHGASMLFGWFGGGGFARTKASFERMGFRPLLPFALAAPATQLVCGALVVLGLGWPLGPALLIGPMTVAVVAVHWPRIWATEQGIEFPLVMGAVMAGLGLLPPGQVSVDELLGAHLPRVETFLVVFVLAELASLGAIVSNAQAKRRRARAKASAEAAPANG